MPARFVHTNIVAHDWRRLADFYQRVFGCAPVPPERHLAGAWIEAATGVPGAEIHGAHLRLPGHGTQGPTLEIFQYNRTENGTKPAINRPGLAHIAFAVDDVEAARAAVLKAGGTAVGEVVNLDVPGAGKVTFVYVTFVYVLACGDRRGTLRGLGSLHGRLGTKRGSSAVPGRSSITAGGRCGVGVGGRIGNAGEPGRLSRPCRADTSHATATQDCGVPCPGL